MSVRHALVSSSGRELARGLRCIVPVVSVAQSLDVDANCKSELYFYWFDHALRRQEGELI